MNKKVLSVLVVLTLMLTVLSAFADGDPIKIGVVDSYTGGHSAYGLASLDGYTLAHDLRPEALGRPIELNTYDVKSDKAETALAASRAIADGNVALLGTASSGFTIAMNEVAAEKGIPTVTNFSTNQLVTQGNDIAFRSCFIDPYQGEVLAKFAYEDLGAKTAVLLVDISTDYPVGIANYFREAWTKIAGEDALLSYLSLMLGDKDFSAQLTEIKRLNPDVVVVPDDYAETGLILKQARELGLTMPFLGGDAVDLPEFAEIAGEDALKEGFYMTAHYHKDAYDNESAKAFGEAFKAKYNREPDASAATAYDAYNMLIDAIERAGTDDSELIRQEMYNTKDFEGASGTININENGDAEKSCVIQGFVNGEKQIISIVEP